MLTGEIFLRDIAERLLTASLFPFLSFFPYLNMHFMSISEELLLNNNDPQNSEASYSCIHGSFDIGRIGSARVA